MAPGVHDLHPALRIDPRRDPMRQTDALANRPAPTFRQGEGGWVNENNPKVLKPKSSMP